MGNAVTKLCAISALIGAASVVAACATIPAKQRVEGYVDIECTLAPDRKPVDCVVVEENSTGYGFGAEAMAVIMRGTLSSASASSVGQKFRTRIRISTDVENHESTGRAEGR